MLIKLVKNEFIATYRRFTTIYLGILLLSVLMSLFSSFDEELMFILVALAFAGLLIGTIVIFAIQSIRLYTSDLYSARGYLSLTLPVKTWQLLLSKIITMIIWYFITFLVIVTAFFLFAFSQLLINGIEISISEIVNAIQDFLKLPLHVYVLWFFSSLASIFMSITVIGISATCVCTGWIRKGKWMVAVLIYFVLNYTTSFINSIITRIIFPLDSGYLSSLSLSTFQLFGLSYLEPTLSAQAWYSICFSLIIGILAFVGTVWLIDNKIEIE